MVKYDSRGGIYTTTNEVSRFDEVYNLPGGHVLLHKSEGLYGHTYILSKWSNKHYEDVLSLNWFAEDPITVKSLTEFMVTMEEMVAV